MEARSEFPPLDLDCQIAVALVTNGMEQLGLRVTRSFDLRNAACVPRPDLPCPHHGTVPCTCQLVVLLVYGEAGPPVSLVAHGCDHQTGFYVVDDPAQPADAATQAILRQALSDLSLWESPNQARSHAS